MTAIAKAYPKKATADDWTAYLTGSLRNAALNWLRSRERYEARVTSEVRRSAPETEDDVSVVDLAAALELNVDDRIAFERMLKDASPIMRRVWDVMPLAHFDQTEAARLLGVSRSAVGNAWRQLRVLLKRHGF